jgi:DNA-binding MarR family transcriptional regulator
LWLTPKSKPVLEHIAQLIAETRAETLHGLSNEERGQLIDLLGRVHANLSALPPLPAEKAQRSSR